jgi:class 3 adenylate cyclase/hemoglobin-like flavoprotein
MQTTVPDPHAPGGDPSPAPAAKPLPRVTFEDDGVIATVDDPEATLLEVSVRHKVPHFRECGGRGRCTTCRVHVFDGLSNLSDRTAREAKIAEERRWLPHIRLACQARVRGDVRLRRLIRTPADVSIVQTERFQSEQARELELAILVCDIRQFTPFADRHLSFDVVHVLNRFFGLLGEPILLNNGIIYQYVGDEIIGLFGLDGGSAAQNALRAVRAGLGMLEALSVLNESIRDEFGVELEVGLGAHVGMLVVGNMGHPSKQAFSAIGDAMNVASRIEAANKALGTHFLVSETLYDYLPVPVREGQHEAVELKGKVGTRTVVEVLGFANFDADLVVQRTAQRLLGDAERFGEIFYRRLFEAAPVTRDMFDGEVGAQQNMLTQALRLAVYGLSRFDQVAPGLAVLGSSHRGYGVEAAHYDVFHTVFLETLREALGEAATPEVEAAWQEAVGRITTAMQAGAGYGMPTFSL